ncbi:MAG: GNAT family N-acetyltransferase [Armatimonadota bacterium]
MPVFLSSRPEPVTVRPATRKDLDAIGNLWIELMSFHAALDPRFRIPSHGREKYMRHTQEGLADRHYRVLVAEDNGRVIGYISGYIALNPPIFPTPRYGFIADLCVTAHSRRRGVGRSLVTALRHWFQVNDMEHVQLNVAHCNPVSQAFWRKVGCSDYLDHMWLSLKE